MGPAVGPKGTVIGRVAITPPGERLVLARCDSRPIPGVSGRSPIINIPGVGPALVICPRTGKGSSQRRRVQPKRLAPRPDP